MKRKSSISPSPRVGSSRIPDGGIDFPPPIPLPPEWQLPEKESPRGRILAAARDLFAQKGLEATSVREITEAAGVNSAMVHYYFRNKEELYRRVLGHELLSVFREIHSQIAPQTSAGELLVSLPTRLMRVVRDNPVWARLLSREVAGGAEHLQRVIIDLKDAGPLGIRSVAEDLYNEGVKRGELRDFPVSNVIQFLLVLGYSGVFYNLFFRVLEKGDPDEERSFNERQRVFDRLLRHALMPEKKTSHRS